MKCGIPLIDMYEPYLNREKQFLKMNAELDTRFKDIDHMKCYSADVVKPRLNVFGNGSRVNNQSPKAVVLATKQKRTEIKCRTNSCSALYSNRNVLSETVSLDKSTDKFVDKRETSETSVANIRSNQGNDCPSETKLLNQLDNYSTAEAKLSPGEATVKTTINYEAATSTTNDATVKKNISSDGLIKFLKSKVAILKQELERSQQENVKNIRAYEGNIESNKKNVAQLDLVNNENEALKSQVDKLQKANNIYESVVEEKDADLATLNKEIFALKKQLKEVNRLHNSLEKRFLKCEDDLEHTKKNLHQSQECERQQRVVNHQQKNFFEDQIKQMSKQRTGLISAYKRQLLLLDNLKRQNLCLEQSKLLQLAEKDFMKILDWNN